MVLSVEEYFLPPTYHCNGIRNATLRNSDAPIQPTTL